MCTLCISDTSDNIDGFILMQAVIKLLSVYQKVYSLINMNKPPKITQISSTLFSAAVVGVSFYCEYGWLLHGSRCYKRFVGDITGYDARRACQKHGAFLASIKDASVQDFLQTNGISL